MERTQEQGRLSEQLRDLRDELEKTADEIRVKIHLAGMDVKDAWKELEPKLYAFEQRAERATEKVQKELHDIGVDLRARMKKLRSQL